MSFEATLQIIPLVIGIVLNWGLAIFLQSRRPANGAGALSALMACMGCWSAGVLAQVVTPDFETHYIILKFTYIFIVFGPVAWLAFCFDVSGYGRWLTGRALLGICIVPAVASILSIGNWNHVFRFDERMMPLGTLHFIENGRAPAWWISAGYAYLLVSVGYAAMVRSALRAPAVYRKKAYFVLGSASLPWIANGLFIAHLSPLGDLDPTPFVFSLMGGGLAAGLFRYRLLDLVPVARDLIVEAMPDCQLTLDEYGRIVDMNPAARRLLGHAIPIGMPATLAVRAWPELESVIDGEVSSAELAIEDRWWEYSRLPLQPRLGGPRGSVVFLRDITERKRSEIATQAALEAAQAATKAKSEFLATMSHELRTPLNGVIGMTQLLLTTRLTTDQQDYADTIRRSGEVLLSVINGVLDFSKIEAGRMDLEQEPFSLHTVVEGTADLLRYGANSKGLDLLTVYQSSLPERLIGDAAKLRQVLFNLVGNAIKFTAQGKVEVSVECPRKEADFAWIRITVIDTGIGITEEQKRRLFQPFFQADSSMTRRFGGSGLGLAISRRLVELMGGILDVDSEPGAGSRFWMEIRFPLAAGS